MKERVLVSACLVGVNCKYDGKNNYSNKIMEYIKDKEVFLVCPEQLGGLKTPRISAERKKDIVITKDNQDVTKSYQIGAEEVLEIAKKFGIKKAILKSKSPSCGKSEIYDGSFSHALIKGAGITAELLMKNKIEVISSDEIEKLVTL